MDTNFSAQPFDTIVDIVSLLNSEELDTVCHVNTTLSGLCDNPDFWRAIADKKYIKEWSKIVYLNVYKPKINSKRDFFRVAAANNDIFIGIEKYIGPRRAFIVAARIGDLRLVKYFYGLSYMEIKIVQRAKLMVSSRDTNQHTDVEDYIDRIPATGIYEISDLEPTLGMALITHINNDDVNEVLKSLDPNLKQEAVNYALEIDSLDVFDALIANFFNADIGEWADIEEVIIDVDALEIFKGYNDILESNISFLSLWEDSLLGEFICSELLIRTLTEREVVSSLSKRKVHPYNMYLVVKYIKNIHVDVILQEDVLFITVRQLLLNYTKDNTGKDIRALVNTVIDYMLIKNIDIYNSLKILKAFDNIDADKVHWYELIQTLPVSR